MKTKNNSWNVLAVIVLGMIVSRGAYAATIAVEAGGDLAAANASAVAGDVIEIAAGTYNIAAALVIKDGVTYQGAGSGATILDCNGLTRAFTGRGNIAQNDELPYSADGYPENTSGPKDWMIKGCTIVNGVADAVGKSIERVGEDPDLFPPLEANVITNPDKTTNGGAIVLENGAEGILMDVAFENCSAPATDEEETASLGQGGAVYMNDATADMNDCSFMGCSASDDGGAVYATNADLKNMDLSIENSTFTNNIAGDDGGAICAIRRNIDVVGCTSVGNRTEFDPDDSDNTADGAFLYAGGAQRVGDTTGYADVEMVSYGGVVKVTDCNITDGFARRGGAMRAESAAQLIVTDTYISNCHGTTGQDGGGINASGISPLNPDANAVGEPGIYLDGVTVDNCTTGDDGGGIDVDNYSTGSSSRYLESIAVVINNSTFSNCRAGLEAPDNNDRRGGGIHVNQRMDVTITNTIVDNCTSGKHGAGMYIDGPVDSCLIDRCVISNCSNDDSSNGGDGAAVMFDDDSNMDVTVSNSIFVNSTNFQDQAVVRIDGRLVTVANCTFVGNTAAEKGPLYFGADLDPAIVNMAINNLFVNNDSSPGSDETLGWSKANNNIANNNVFYGSILDGSDKEIKSNSTGTGNFEATTDPLVDTANGDYHLAAGSEAINAGTADGAPDHDFAGNPRPQGAAPDVGAYEAM
ncbi:choice-of-anchor Q domain-containing protein [Planctomycetota bacterium]